MAYQRGGKGKWIVSYRIPGRTQPEKEYFDSKREAEARELVVKSIKKINPAALAPEPVSGLTFRNLVDQYQTRRALAATTLAADIYTLEAWVFPVIGDKVVEKITEEDLSKIVEKASQKSSPGSGVRIWERVRAVLRWGKKYKLINKNPGADFFVEKDKQVSKAMPPSREEVEAILDVSPPHLVRAIQLAFYLGVRPGQSELFALRWDDFNLEDGWVRVMSADKGGLPWRDVPLARNILPLLNRWKADDDAAGIAWPIHWRGKPVSSVKGAWENAKAAAGITRRIRLYDIRHHFATSLLEQGVDPGIVAGMMGHTTVRMVQEVYQRVRRAGKRSAIDKLPSLKKRNVLKKTVKVHILVIEKYLGRALEPDEDVYHLDGNKKNFKIWNLELIRKEDRKRLDFIRSSFNGASRRKYQDDNSAWCYKCQSFKPKSDFPKNSRNWSGVGRECKACKRESRIQKPAE